MDDFEEVVVANRYLEAISPYVPSVVSGEFATLVDFTRAVSAQGSFNETDEVNDNDSRVAAAVEALNAFVDERCLGRTGANG
jgi:hypothetical protein